MGHIPNLNCRNRAFVICWSDESRECGRDRLFGLQLDATSDITHPVRVGATIINIYPLTTGVSTFYLALLPT